MIYSLHFYASGKWTNFKSTFKVWDNLFTLQQHIFVGWLFKTVLYAEVDENEMKFVFFAKKNKLTLFKMRETVEIPVFWPLFYFG